MLSIPGKPGAVCDGMSRRELMRVGGAGLMGLSLSQFLELQASAKGLSVQGSGKQPDTFGGAKNVILVFLQGGPSHLDIWDPKPDAPDNIRSRFQPIKTRLKGVYVTELMPNLAKVLDRTTLIRSVSYTPVGLFNHTAAIYQMMTGYTPDKVSPSGQLEPPNRNDFPCIGAEVARLKPIDKPMLPLVQMPRPLQESNVIGKGGTAGFLGAAYDPYYLFQDPNKPLNLDDLSLRKEVSKTRMRRRASLLQKINAAMPAIDKAVEPYALDEY